MAYVRLERPRAHIALVTLDRPERYNALGTELLEDFHRVLDDLERDTDTRVVILSGAGKGFCAGADLQGGGFAPKRDKEGLGPVQQAWRTQARYGDLSVRLHRLPQPVIAAVNGPAAGGGFAIALASDLRICTPTAKFNCAFIRIGIGAADMAVSYFLPRLVGSALAAELMYTGRFVEAREALEAGIVSRVVEPEKLLDTAYELAQLMVDTAAPFALRVTKEALRLSQGGLSLEEVVAIENRNQVLAVQTADFMEAVGAWAQKKTPDYKDR